MIRWALLLLLTAMLAGYAFWVYLRVDLAVPSAKRLAAVRALALALVLTLLFDVRLPAGGLGGVSTEWALLDASLSMGAAGVDGATAWEAASARARELAADGFDVVTFGGDPPGSTPADAEPSEISSLLVPALQRAAEGGARSVVVLSDGRFEDRVAVRSTLATLPLSVEFERFGGEVVNAGISRLLVPDFVDADEGATATVEVHGGLVGDTLTVEVSAEGEVVATTRVPAPAAGLRVEAEVDLPPPTGAGRLRYSASVRLGGDAFPDDDVAVDYAAVGREEGALVLLSLVPDWEPRYLLPVLREVTGLPTLGYLRAGPDRFVRAGRALDRGDPVDSTTVREAMTDAALVVVHGLGGELDDWTRAVVRQPERRILLVHDPDGAALVGLSVGPPRPGEWYVSADVPPSPIAGALSGVSLQGLPPLTDVLVAREPEGAAPLLLQLRGAGAPVAALHLADQPSGRVAVSLASGFWRWAAREDGREPYRRLWSGVVGWILADQAVVAAAPRPAEWVVDRGAPVVWSIPPGVGETRIRVSGADSVVVDTVVTGGGRISTGSLPPGPYSFVVGGAASDTVASGRFDVATGTNEMLPAATDPEPGPPSPSLAAGDSRAGRPLRTYPWPYLLVIALLCGEWIGRRRSGLR